MMKEYESKMKNSGKHSFPFFLQTRLCQKIRKEKKKKSENTLRCYSLFAPLKKIEGETIWCRDIHIDMYILVTVQALKQLELCSHTKKKMPSF
jgi:hypothetical protein